LGFSSQNISYAFVDGSLSGNQIQQDKVHRLVIEWSRYANLTFISTTDIQNAQIRISFDSTDGNWSRIGTDALKVVSPEPTMNLAVVDDTGPANDIDTGVILHEFGHVLGLLHEFQSPERPGHVTLKEDGKSYLILRCVHPGLFGFFLSFSGDQSIYP